MATSLVRLGRLGSLKCLLHERWATLRTPFAALCTKGDAPPKTTTKAKAATIEAEKRASLLAYKHTVAFPSQLSSAGILPKDIVLGETGSVVAAAAITEQLHPASSEELTKETENALPASEIDESVSNVMTTGSSVAIEEISMVQTIDDFTTADEGCKASDVNTEEQRDEKDTSSSSSSDSESDSDDENPEKPTKTETVKPGGKDAEEKKAEVLRNKLVEFESIIASSALFGKDARAVTKTKSEEVVTSGTIAADLKEALIDPAPVISTSMTKVIPEVSGESIAVVSMDKMVDTASEVKTAPSEDIVENEAEPQAKAATEEKQQPVNIRTSAPVVPEETIEASPKEVANTIVEASPGEVNKAQKFGSEAVQVVVTKPKFEDASETMAKAVGATEIEPTPSEDLKDPLPEAAHSVEFLTETEVVETSEEQAPEKAPEPEPEPFDNTTYKNLQHHNYNMYTFADMDLQMSSLRLPQPSSGRPSPRH